MKVETTITVQIGNTGMVCDGKPLAIIIGDCIQHVIKIVDEFDQRFFAE